MASKRQVSTGKWEYTVKRAKLLPKPLYLTFDKEEEGDDYVRRLEALLDRGIVPPEFGDTSKPINLGQLINTYMREAPVKMRDVETLNSLMGSVSQVPLTALNVKWVDTFVTKLKQIEQLAPSTIRAKVGALARCTDWGVRKGHLILPDQPFRTLPKGYSSYTEDDVKVTGKRVEDIERDRRLHDGEYEAILKVIRGGVLKRKFRPRTLEDVQALEDLFIVALETAMRMSEIYTLGKDQVMVGKSTVFLTKTKNGDKRQVPLSSVAVPIMERRVRECKGTELFPWWEEGKDRKEVTSYLSKLFASIFDEAGCGDLHFHDLRHEATSRLFERTRLSGEEIMKITGHRNHRMVMRYLNLRASELASALW